MLKRVISGGQTGVAVLDLMQQSILVSLLAGTAKREDWQKTAPFRKSIR